MTIPLWTKRLAGDEVAETGSDLLAPVWSTVLSSPRVHPYAQLADDAGSHIDPVNFTQHGSFSLESDVEYDVRVDRIANERPTASPSPMTPLLFRSARLNPRGPMSSPSLGVDVGVTVLVRQSHRRGCPLATASLDRTNSEMNPCGLCPVRQSDRKGARGRK
jgi:hypothetical protein